MLIYTEVVQKTLRNEVDLKLLAMYFVSSQKTENKAR